LNLSRRTPSVPVRFGSKRKIIPSATSAALLEKARPIQADLKTLLTTL